MDETGEIPEVSGQEIPSSPKTPLEMVSRATLKPVDELRSEFVGFAPEGLAQNGGLVDPDNLFIMDPTQKGFDLVERAYGRYNPQKGGFEKTQTLTLGVEGSDPLDMRRKVSIRQGGEDSSNWARVQFGGDEKYGAKLFARRGNTKLDVKFSYDGRLTNCDIEDVREDAFGHKVEIVFNPDTGHYEHFLGQEREGLFSWHEDEKGNLVVSHKNTEGEEMDSLLLPTASDLLSAREAVTPDALLKNPTMPNTEIDKSWKMDPVIAMGGRWEHVVEEGERGITSE